MHSTIIASLLPFLLVLPTNLALPSDALIGGYDGSSSKTSCSANQKGSIPAWASNPTWATSMASCLNEMNSTKWDGNECKPAAADGTTLGPSFNFWKGNDKYDNGLACFDACKDCLTNGINWQQAQTTSCKHTERPNWHSKKQTCTMGFDYGIWAQTGTATPPS